MTNLYDIGSYADMTITVPANSSFNKGLVLGCASDSNKLLPYYTTAGTGAASPEYVLVKHDGIKNETSAPVDVIAKVLCVGRVNAYGLCFADEADTIDSPGVLTALKNNGILAERVENYVEENL